MCNAPSFLVSKCRVIDMIRCFCLFLACIDHRRVPNLQTFFKRRGASLPITQNAADYLPGDLITCTVAGRLPHIAIVVPAPDGGTTPWIVHNIGQGPKGENRLFEFPLTGHYRFHPAVSGR